MGCSRLALRCAFNNRYVFQVVLSKSVGPAQTGKRLNPAVGRHSDRVRPDRSGGPIRSHEAELYQRQIDATDREIDRLVYELYGLTEEEIKIVEAA